MTPAAEEPCRRSAPPGRSASPTTSSRPWARFSGARPTTSSWRSTPSCGASTAPTSRPASTSSGCRPRGPGPRRPGRERRGDRRRGRHRRRHPHREPQPPLGDRALPGGGHRGGGDPARHLHHGRPPLGHHGPAVLRPPRRCPPALAARGRGERASRATATRSGCPPSGGADLRSLLRPEPLGQRAVHGRAARPTGWCSASPRARATWPCCSAAAPGATASAGSACWPRPGSPATTAPAAADDTKRPSVQVGDPFEEKRLIEACLELLDKKLVVGIQDLGRCRAGLRHQRDGRPGRRRHGRRRLRRPPAGGGHGALGGDDQREPGAHAGHRHPRVLGRRGRDLRHVGGAGGRRRQGHRPRPRPRAGACASATDSTGRSWPTSRPPRSPTTPRSTTARAAGRPWPGGRRPPSPARRLRRRPVGPPAVAALGLPPVRPPTLLEHGGGPGR